MRCQTGNEIELNNDLVALVVYTVDSDGADVLVAKHFNQLFAAAAVSMVVVPSTLIIACSIEFISFLLSLNLVMGLDGRFELPTCALRMRCSTN